MDQLFKWLIFGSAFMLAGGVLLLYFLKKRRDTRRSERKLASATEKGLHEPVTIYPFVDPTRCIGSGACVMACPEVDVLGLRHGRAVLINASRCIGHGACLNACPTEAISLRIGTEKRGVDLPELTAHFETTIKGVFVAGELGGMGLIRNAVTQGKEAIDYIHSSIKSSTKATYDVIIVGAGPAGISATLQAKKLGMNVLTLEQDTLGGTIYTFPRSKIVMTAPMDLPTYGKVKMRETSKTELLELWNEVLSKNDVHIHENTRVTKIDASNGIFHLTTQEGVTHTTTSVLLAIGRRGSPRKLNIPGENSEKVAFRMIEPEHVSNKRIVVVGGGDAAIEAALLLAYTNEVVISYRGNQFNRLKAANAQKIVEAINNGALTVLFNTALLAIEETSVRIKKNDTGDEIDLPNDLVYIFAGGELPRDFLQNIGIQLTTKHGETILKK